MPLHTRPLSEIPQGVDLVAEDRHEMLMTRPLRISTTPHTRTRWQLTRDRRHMLNDRAVTTLNVTQVNVPVPQVRPEFIRAEPDQPG